MAKELKKVKRSLQGSSKKIILYRFWLLLGMSASVIAFAISSYNFMKPITKAGMINKRMTEIITTTSKSLNDLNVHLEENKKRISELEKEINEFLSVYLEENKKQISELEMAVNELESKKEYLNKMVEADEQTIAAYDRFYYEESKKMFWLGAGSSFVLGIIASLIANFIWSKRKKKENDVIKEKEQGTKVDNLTNPNKLKFPPIGSLTEDMRGTQPQTGNTK